MKDQIEKFFSPVISLVIRKNRRYPRNRWYPNTTKDESLLRQFMQEASIRETTFGPSVTTDQLDEISKQASKHGFCLETIGES